FNEAIALGLGKDAQVGKGGQGYAWVQKYAASAAEAVELIESDEWPAVSLLTYGFINLPELDLGSRRTHPMQPVSSLDRSAQGESSMILSQAGLVGPLKKARARTVNLLGGRAARTGLARGLSKDLPGVSVWGDDNDVYGTLEPRWDKAGKTVIVPDLQASLWEYRNGYLIRDGKPSKTRPPELGDPDPRKPGTTDVY